MRGESGVADAHQGDEVVDEGMSFVLSRGHCASRGIARGRLCFSRHRFVVPWHFRGIARGRLL